MVRPRRRRAPRSGSTPGRTHPLVAAAALVAASGCNAPDPPGPTGGTDTPPGECGRGLVVVQSDYQSTNVSLIGLDGEVLSSSFISSATTSAQLSAPLSGDVVAPTMPNFGEEIALLDRYPASVLTWVAVDDGEVRAQLNVSTGFAANPQDYAALSDDKAYVSRYERNHQPGNEPFDQGSDLLILDPATPTITGRVDLGGAVLAGEQGFEPHPNRMVLADQTLLVLLALYTPSYLDSASSRLARIDTTTDTLQDVTVLDGLHGCSGVALSPSGAELAVACSGKFGGGTAPSLAESGVVLLSVEDDGAGETILSESRRFMAAELGGQPIGFTVAFADEDRLLVVVLGAFGTGGAEDRPDQLLEIDLQTGQAHPVMSSPSMPFELGEVRCTGSCEHCYVAEAEQGVLVRLDPTDAGVELGPSITVDTSIGLPPRTLGRF